MRGVRKGLKLLGMYCLIMDVYMQANHLKSETETYEEKEQQLVNDCVKELSKSHAPFLSLFYSVLCVCVHV